MFDRIVRHLGATASTIAGATFAVVCLLAGSATAAEPIKIGTFLAVTGPASFLGDPELKTLQMYIERINQDGGVLGRNLELVHYDSGGSPKKAVGFAKRLIEQDKVDIIVGASTTGSTLAIVPLVEKAGMPLISLAGSVKIIDPVKKWVFKTPHTDRMACAKIFEDMKKRGIAKVGMISGSGGFGKSMRGQCKSLAGDYGVTIVADETYGKKDTDMTVQLTKIKNSAGLQAVLNPGFGQGPAIVTKNFAQLGIKVPMYQSHGVASKGFIELAGAAAEGVRLPASALLVAELLPDSDPQKPVVLGYKTAYEKKWSSDVSTFGGHAYDGLFLAVRAMKAAGGTDKAKVRDEIEKISGFMGTAGEVNMSASEHLGLDLSAFRMLEIRNGTWNLLD
jgi:branched-chain amino acid transport system substrate-binding protein